MNALLLGMLVQSEMHRFERAGEIVELVGVARITEREFSTWDRHGEPDAKLNEMVRTWLTGDHADRLPRYANRKARFAIFRAVRPDQGVFRGYFGSGRTWNLTASSYASGQYLAAVVTAPPHATTGQAVMTLSKYAPFSESARVEVGQAFRYLGRRYRVISRTQKPPDAKFPAARTKADKTWTITLAVDPPFTPKDGPLRWRALDLDGLYVRVVDENGAPIFAPANIPVDGYQSGYPTIKMPDGQTYAGIFQTPLRPKSPGTIQLTMNIDPNRISGITVQGTVEERVTFRPIPLEPKSGD